MKNFQEIPKSQIFTREQLKAIRGGDDGYYGGGSGGSSCSASCESGKSASITNCNGTCTGYTGYAECVGPNNTLKKNCA